MAAQCLLLPAKVSLLNRKQAVTGQSCWQVRKEKASLLKCARRRETGQGLVNVRMLLQASQVSAEDDMAAPSLMFPNDGLAWGWEKAAPKSSLSELPTPQARTAAAWKLNVIEAIHWASFPLGFYVAHFIFLHTSSISAKLGGDSARVFLIILGLLSQVFGGGISGNMMHVYEGWQVTPFRNPLALPTPSASSLQVDQIRVPCYNNAWLRAVAYMMLFTFQVFGLSCFSMAVFGINPWTTTLVLGSTAIALYGPHKPFFVWERLIDGAKRPVLPLPLSLLVVFGVNVLINLGANWVFFYEPLQSLLPSLPPWLVGLLSVLPPLLIGGGGGVEGGIAEATFNQWHHFIAFVILMLGLAFQGGLYYLLFG